MEFTATLAIKDHTLGPITDSDVSWTQTGRSVKEFMEAHPRSAYTAMRTTSKKSIINFNKHAKRLFNSYCDLDWSNSMPPYTLDPVAVNQERTGGEMRLDLFTFSSFEVALKRCIEIALPQYVAHSAHLLQDLDEVRTTIMIPKSSSTSQTILIHMEPQICSPYPPKPCTVLIHGAPRPTPSVKDSKWVFDRKLIASKLRDGVNDLILTDLHGNLYEGMTSNFFAVIALEDGTPAVITAPKQFVLGGTILDTVANVCEELGIPFRYEFPQRKDVRAWKGAFITSSFRLILPIGIVETTDGDVVELPRTCETVDKIQSRVWEYLIETAVPILA
ncbi:hypothetical protein HDU80_000095 [Chytriomyces hyalinus]|nr:hypothetical protein HDU80_000095 [Chytriomyces hyalinus]